MKGTIIDVNIQSSTGLILGEDSMHYELPLSECKESDFPIKGASVDFDAGESTASAVYHNAFPSPSTPPAAPSRQSATQPRRPSRDAVMDYSQVPWYRKHGVCSGLLIASLLTLGMFPGVLIVVIIVLTGDVYQKTFDAKGNLIKWGKANKVIAVILAAIYVFAILGAFTAR